MLALKTVFNSNLFFIMFCVCTVTSQWYQSRSRTPENLISISGHCWGGRDLGSPVVHIEKVCVHSDGGVAPSQLSSVQIKIEPICLMVELCTMVKILLHKGKSKLSNWRFLGKHSESIVEFSTKGIIVWIIYLNILLSVIFKGLGAYYYKVVHCVRFFPGLEQIVIAHQVVCWQI